VAKKFDIPRNLCGSVPECSGAKVHCPNEMATRKTKLKEEFARVILRAKKKQRSNLCLWPEVFVLFCQFSSFPFFFVS
jgi:hypothetical protein